MLLVSQILFSCSFLLFLSRRILNYLRFFQQEDYRPKRFLKWFLWAKAFDTKGTLILALAFLGRFFFEPTFLYFVLSFGFLYSFFKEEDPRVFGKIPLKMTNRAKRLFFVSLSLSFILLLSAYALGDFFKELVFFAFFLQMQPLILLISWLFLHPDEKRRQNKFLRQASLKLEKVDPFVIGITGSYGKTSTKHALAHLLNTCVGPTFFPKGSVNTPMGITVEVNEKLKPYHQFAVIEMAAYGIGSIRNLSCFTKPKAAILTNIGLAHLERFKLTETIQKAKAELAEALPKGGLLVCNGDSPLIREIAKNHRDKNIIFYGYSDHLGPLDLLIEFKENTLKGTSFTFTWKGKCYSGTTPLFGKANLSNIAASFAMSSELGGNPDFLMAAIGCMEPVNNRLEIKQDKGVTYIKDAYNSNPLGFKDALEVMEALPGQRKFLMTPGMIELGPLQAHENEEAGKRASRFLDTALIVGKVNREALNRGLSSQMTPSQVLFFDFREEALAFLKKEAREGDVILLENDLTDIYESKSSF